MAAAMTPRPAGNEFDLAASASSDPAVAAKLRALSNLHSAKVHALMRSIHALRTEVSGLRSQAKEHRRSALVQALRAQASPPVTMRGVLALSRGGQFGAERACIRGVHAQT